MIVINHLKKKQPKHESMISKTNFLQNRKLRVQRDKSYETERREHNKAQRHSPVISADIFMLQKLLLQVN